jgi:hypothetical protein
VIKWLFKRACRRQDIPEYSAEAIWQAFAPHTKSSWFLKFYGKSLLRANKYQLLLSMLLLDFLTGDGVDWTLQTLRRYLEPKHVTLAICQFCRDFQTGYGRHYLENPDQVAFDTGSYDAMRRVFTQQLVAILVRESRKPDAEDKYLTRLQGFYCQPWKDWMQGRVTERSA